MDTFIHYGLAASIQAIRDAGLPTNDAARRRRGASASAALVSSGIGGLPLIEETKAELMARGPRRITPFFVPASIINMISGHVSIMFGFQGPNLAIVTACTTGLHSIGMAGRMIEHGDADVMIAGGVGVDDLAARRRRLRRGARALDPQRRSGDGVAPLGQGPRRLRPRRRRRRPGARGVRAREAARRQDLRRAGRLRHGRRRLPHDGAERRGPEALDGRRAALGRHQRRPGPVPQRPRHLDAARRRQRDQRDQARVRRPCEEAGRQLDQVDDRAPARRRRRHRVGVHRPRGARTRSRRRRSTSSTRIPSATWTTAPTPRGR